MKHRASNRIGRIALIGISLLLALNLIQTQGIERIVRIGVLDDTGELITKGAELAIWQINDAGGVQGADGNSMRLELVIQQVASGESIGNAIATLAQSNVVAVLGPGTTESVLNNLPSLQNLNVPVLTPALGDTVIAADATGTLFRIRSAERLQGAALADVLVNDFNIRQITTVQFDSASTGGRVGLSVALGSFSPAPLETSLLYTGGDIGSFVTEVLSGNPPAIATYGPPRLAAQLYARLRAAGWTGIFAYDDAENAAFRSLVPRNDLNGILGTTTWPLADPGDAGMVFASAYMRAFGEVPDAVSAASYDAIYLLATALGQPGVLKSNLSSVRNVQGVQGTLNPSGLTVGETSVTVAVVQLNTFGGADIVAKYIGSERMEDAGGSLVVESPPLPTATPEGVVLTVKSAVQNVRTGPGLVYDVLGQVRSDEQIQVIGATTDYSWVVIAYRNQQGWLASYLLDIFGDLSTLPVVPIPPTPTPGPPTATPTPMPIADIVITAASPINITLGTPTNIIVTVANIGGANAGPFAIAATFPPDNILAAANLTELSAGMQQVISLPITLSSMTGNFDVVIVADLNQQIAESAEGEDNNDDFVYSYHLDRQTILTNTASLGTGTYIDLEGNVGPINDIQYTAAGLVTANPLCTATTDCIGLSANAALTWNTIHYRSIRPGNGINATFIPNAFLTPGTIVGVLTAEGRRAVLRVDNINPGVTITFTYRVYQ
jgi:branched-chain amino acid transport system substrate-binding protein